MNYDAYSKLFSVVGEENMGEQLDEGRLPKYSTFKIELFIDKPM